MIKLQGVFQRVHVNCMVLSLAMRTLESLYAMLFQCAQHKPTKGG